MSRICFGRSHHRVPLGVRERFTTPNFALPDPLARLKIMPGVNEGLTLGLQSHRILCVRRAPEIVSEVFSKTSTETNGGTQGNQRVLFHFGFTDCPRFVEEKTEPNAIKAVRAKIK
jgi:hypothetical protein